MVKISQLLGQFSLRLSVQLSRYVNYLLDFIKNLILLIIKKILHFRAGEYLIGETVPTPEV